MTKSARHVLDDCREALADLDDGVQGPEWRRRWIAAVVLLRAVGHVLDKVDGRRSDSYRRAVDRAWTNLNSSNPEPRIFWEFIDQYRNSILKEYELGAGQGVTVYAGSDRPSTYSYKVLIGYFRGRDQRKVIREAIEWWELYLNGIDADARETL